MIERRSKSKLKFKRGDAPECSSCINYMEPCQFESLGHCHRKNMKPTLEQIKIDFSQPKERNGVSWHICWPEMFVNDFCSDGVWYVGEPGRDFLTYKEAFSEWMKKLK